jgi:hypothetical protein
MRTLKLKIAAAFIAALCILHTGSLKAQACCHWYDLSSAAGWSQVNTGVAVTGGAITFTGAADGYQPRFVYTMLPTPMNDDSWACDFKFNATSGNGPFHTLIAFTESGSPVINAHGMRTMQAGTVTYSNTHCIEARLESPANSAGPTTWTLVGASKKRTGTYGYNQSSMTWCTSAGIPLPANAFSVALYGRLSRLSPTLGMISLYSDANRSVLIGCETFCIDAAVSNLSILQSGNCPGGALSRTFYGKVDEINACDIIPTLTGDTTVCTTAIATNYVLNNNNGCTFAGCGFPGATGYTWSVPGGSTMNPGSWGTCFNTATGHGNSCLIDVGTDGYVSCTVNYPCTTVVYKIYVDVFTPPTAAITSSTPFCYGETILVSGSGSTNETSYQWAAAECNSSGGIIGAWNLGPTTNGTAGSFNLATIVSPSLLICHKYYMVNLKTFNAGCHFAQANHQIEIVCVPTVTAVSNPTLICPGGSANLTASGATTYTWTPSTGLSCTNCPNPVATPSSTQIYTVTGTTSGCSDPATVTVNVSTLSANAGPDYDICCFTGSYIFPLSVSGGTPAYSYSWSPTTNLFCSHAGLPHAAANCPNPGVKTCQTTVYTVTVTDAAGCVVTDQVTITPIACRMSDPGSEPQGEAENKLTVYPNPATQQATINTGDVLAQSILITDALGREVYNVKPVSTLTQIDLETFPAGIYMVKVLTNNEMQTIQLVIEK